jgi:hypothetical protein
MGDSYRNANDGDDAIKSYLRAISAGYKDPAVYSDIRKLAEVNAHESGLKRKVIETLSGGKDEETYVSAHQLG